MIKIAVSTTGASLDSSVPALFEDATHLLILDAETDELLQVVEAEGMEPFERSLYFADKTVEFDCEALLCGGLEQEPFAILAETNCVTRYNAAGHGVLDGIHKMNKYALALIPDFIGGTGCPDNNPANCELDHDHGHDH